MSLVTLDSIFSLQELRSCVSLVGNESSLAPLRDFCIVKI